MRLVQPRSTIAFEAYVFAVVPTAVAGHPSQSLIAVGFEGSGRSNRGGVVLMHPVWQPRTGLSFTSRVLGSGTAM